MYRVMVTGWLALLSRLRGYASRWLPPVCVVCGSPLGAGAGAPVCEPCWLRAPRAGPPHCIRCGIPLGNKEIAPSTSCCIECVGWLPYLQRARSAFVMRGSAAAVVHALKFGGWTSLADAMAERMAAVSLGDIEAEIGAVVPVPLSVVRLRERGFNQAELLARELARRRGWPLRAGALVRRRHTRPQARLAPAERRRNVRGAFEVPTGARSGLAARHVLVVDDVLTTGWTALGAARALCGAGARAVSVLTFARARPSLAVEAALSPGGFGS